MTIHRTTTALLLLLVSAGTGAACTDTGEPDDLHHEGGALAAAKAADQQTAARSDHPTDVTITVSGDDCPITFSSQPSGDFEAVSMLFEESMLTEERRSVHCSIGIDYEFPAGWRLWRPGAIARGVQMLPDGDQRLAWAVRTRLDSGRWSDEFARAEGPVNDDLMIELKDGEQAGEAPTACGATTAHVDVELFGALFLAGAPSSTPLGTVDAIDTFFDWERCP